MKEKIINCNDEKFFFTDFFKGLEKKTSIEDLICNKDKT